MVSYVLQSMGLLVLMLLALFQWMVWMLLASRFLRVRQPLVRCLWMTLWSCCMGIAWWSLGPPGQDRMGALDPVFRSAWPYFYRATVALPHMVVLDALLKLGGSAVVAWVPLTKDRYLTIPQVILQAVFLGTVLGKGFPLALQCLFWVASLLLLVCLDPYHQSTEFVLMTSGWIVALCLPSQWTELGYLLHLWLCFCTMPLCVGFLDSLHNQRPWFPTFMVGLLSDHTQLRSRFPLTYSQWLSTVRQKPALFRVWWYLQILRWAHTFRCPSSRIFSLMYHPPKEDQRVVRNVLRDHEEHIHMLTRTQLNKTSFRKWVESALETYRDSFENECLGTPRPTSLPE
jgi:hypothetical protein